MPPREELERLKLGHILYSNCFPVHARLLDRPRDDDPILVEGVPSTLNRLLSERRIDVAPSSSIEYALNADRYRLFPDLVIGSREAVRSILLVSDRSVSDLDREIVALPTASATSVVLLRILCHFRWGVKPRFRWFDQSTEDPFVTGAAAALFIGDVALRPAAGGPDRSFRLDLGAEWWEETRLPFAFALWQTSASGREKELSALHGALRESRAFGTRERERLARDHAWRFGMDPEMLAGYWATLAFDLDDEMIRGLLRFYELAAEIGAIPRVPALRWVEDR